MKNVVKLMSGAEEVYYMAHCHLLEHRGHGMIFGVHGSVSATCHPYGKKDGTPKKRQLSLPFCDFIGVIRGAQGDNIIAHFGTR